MLSITMMMQFLMVMQTHPSYSSCEHVKCNIDDDDDGVAEKSFIIIDHLILQSFSLLKLLIAS